MTVYGIVFGGRFQFQSTSPVWGMTINKEDAHDAGSISIHIPRVGDDDKVSVRFTKHRKFQSTSPVWGMT